MFKTDAPAACGHEITYVDSPSGPKAQPCPCASANDASSRKGPIELAQDRADAERKLAGQEGPPGGPNTLRRKS